MPKFSIHIAVYNCERHITQTLRTLRAHTDPELEILVFDDASNDKSVDLVRQEMDDDPRIRLIDSKVNYGIAGSRERMLHETESAYIIVLDHDDILLPLPLEQYEKLFEDNPELSCIYGKKRHVDDNLQDQQKYQGNTFSRFNLFHANMACHPGSILRRSAVLQAGGYMDGSEGKKSRFGDFFLWSRMCMRGELLFVNRYHLLYRTHPGQASHAQSSDIENRYVEEWILRHNRDLHETLAGTGGEIPLQSRRAAMLILGIMCKRSEMQSRIYPNLLNLADQIDPSDYGVSVRKHAFYRFSRQNELALAECDRMMHNFAGNVSICFLAAKLKFDLLLKSQRLTEATVMAQKLEKLQSQLIDDIDWNTINQLLETYRY